MADNIISGYFPKLTQEAAPQATADLGGKPFGHLGRLPNFIRDPSIGGIDTLLARSPEVLGIEDERGSVVLFLPEEATFSNAAAFMGMADPASPNFPGITFAIRSRDDWFARPHSPARGTGIVRRRLRLRLKRLKREREALMARGKMLPERLR